MNNCTAGALILNTRVNTSTSPTSDFGPAASGPAPSGGSGLAAGTLWMHFAVEATRGAADGLPPAWVGLAFAQTAGVMAPGVAVVGAGEPQLGVPGV